MNDPIGFVGLRCANPTYDTFQKKTQRTRRQDIELARRRYQGIGG